jgi:hypothetical protein
MPVAVSIIIAANLGTAVAGVQYLPDKTLFSAFLSVTDLVS